MSIGYHLYSLDFQAVGTVTSMSWDGFILTLPDGQAAFYPFTSDITAFLYPDECQLCGRLSIDSKDPRYHLRLRSEHPDSIRHVCQRCMEHYERMGLTR